VEAIAEENASFFLARSHRRSSDKPEKGEFAMNKGRAVNIPQVKQETRFARAKRVSSER
jgi:hypothetical protein